MNQSERVNLNSPTIPAFFVRWVIPRKVKRQLYEAGIGRHTEDEIWHIGRQNVDALSTFLGTLNFFGIRKSVRSGRYKMYAKLQGQQKLKNVLVIR